MGVWHRSPLSMRQCCSIVLGGSLKQITSHMSATELAAMQQFWLQTILLQVAGFK